MFLFVLVSAIAILAIFLLNAKRTKQINGSKPIHFVYALEGLDSSMNFGNLNEASEYFYVLLNTQTMIVRRAEELYQAGVKSEAVVKYLLLNDPKFILSHGTPMERQREDAIANALKGEFK